MVHPLPAQLQRVIETEHRWREEIRALPIEAKLQILIEMQRWARAIRVATGRPPNPVWDIERREAMELQMRVDYNREPLLESQMDADPIRQLQQWLQEAIEAGVIEPNALCLATVDEEGQPDARFVLLRGLDERGLVFYTNAHSAKGRQMSLNPRVAAVFWWGTLHRQVRVQGTVEKVSEEEADAYFATRPRGHQLAAWASPQSEPIPDRQVLEARMAALEQQYAGRTVPRPPYWIGYRIVPHTMEFWQGRPNRLHDRLRYVRQPDGSWKLERLAP